MLACVAASALAAGSAGGCHPRQASADTTGIGSATGSPAPATAAQIVATAQRYVGSPYASIGDEPATGFSCIGFAHFVFAQNGIYVPEDLNKAYAAAPHVDQTDLQPGDLVFFQNTVWQGLSHVALYIGNGQLIAADSYQTGVEVDNLSDPYWQAHYLGATRPLADPSGTPGVPSSTPVPGPPSDPSPAPPSGPRLDIKAGTTLTPVHIATVYSGPGARYTAIDTVTPAISVTVVQTQGQWVNVSYNAEGQYGWLRGSDLNLPTAPSSAAGNGTGQSATSHGRGRTVGSAAPPGHQLSGTRHAHRPAALSRHTTAGRTLLVTADVLLVRGGPNRHARILRRVHAGDHLRLLTTSGDWDEVVLRDDVRGWVSARWVVDAPHS
ncbi:MAG TPA: NlpC/P60 family protein [Chloroflexota bacterium]|nr:NlpC/P60 family protein [Chloroflexota bacterium]